MTPGVWETDTGHVERNVILNDALLTFIPGKRFYMIPSSLILQEMEILKLNIPAFLSL